MVTKRYKLAYILLYPFVKIRNSTIVKGLENVPESGGMLICANHYSLMDPFLIAYSLGLKYHPHFMAKRELFTNPVIAWFLRKVGTFSVNRGKGDLKSIRIALEYLKEGETVVMFPQGTRVNPEDSSAAKTGAAMIASRARVPIIPVHLENARHHPFRKIKVVFGKAIDLGDKLLSSAELRAAADMIMERITELGKED